ncbi:pyrroline-5-carboxylate reductase [Chitinibacteraceae bacterium HSL-7]
MKMTFIGGGNMATAMLGGMLSQGFAASDIHIVEPDDAKRADFEKQWGVTTSAPGTPLPESAAIVLAVKPQQMKAVAEQLAPQIGQAMLISIAAGIRADALARWFGSERVVRVMPNTPALIRKGISGAYATAAVSSADHALASRILESIGEVVWVDSEDDIDGITAISGSGPAYVFFFIEALQAAAKAQGFDDATARRLAYQTFAGSVDLAMQSSEDAETLRQRVTSKGGTTERAIKAFETSQLRATIIAGASAAAARSRELGEELGRD